MRKGLFMLNQVLKIVKINKMEKESAYTGKLPVGCKHCRNGSKMVLLVTGKCKGVCWYCPLSKKKKGKKVVYSNEKLVGSKEEIIEEENLVKNAEKVGNYLKKGLLDIQEKHEEVTNVRGKGLMCAFNLPSTEQRDDLKERLFKNDLLVLKSGERAIRFRPPLNLTEEQVDKALEIIEKSLKNCL